MVRVLLTPRGGFCTDTVSCIEPETPSGLQGGPLAHPLPYLATASPLGARPCTPCLGPEPRRGPGADILLEQTHGKAVKTRIGSLGSSVLKGGKGMGENCPLMDGQGGPSGEQTNCYLQGCRQSEVGGPGSHGGWNSKRCDGGQNEAPAPRGPNDKGTAEPEWAEEHWKGRSSQCKGPEVSASPASETESRCQHPVWWCHGTVWGRKEGAPWSQSP